MRARFETRRTAVCILLGALHACGGGASAEIAIDQVSPAEGPLGGGQIVVVKGHGFLSGGAAPNMALVGNALAPSINAVGDGEIRLVTPPGSAQGPVDVTIFNANGFGVATGAYTYAGPPAIDAIDPPAGSYRGGDEITIRGSGFRDADAGQVAVTFGDAPSARVEVVDDGQLRAVAPRGAPYQPIDVRVSNRRGSASMAGGYRYTVHGLIGSAGAIFAQSDWGRLYAVDVDAREAVAIGSGPPSGVRLHGMATAPDGRILGYSQQDSFLYQVDLASGAMTRLVGVRPAAGGISRLNDLEFRGDTLFGLDKGLEQIGTIDLETGVWTPVGAPHPVHRSESVASDGASIWFLGNTAEALTLYTIDVSSGALSGTPRVLTLYRGHGASYLDGDVYVAETLRLAGGAANHTLIHRIDPDSGAVTLVAEVPAFIHAMTVAP